MCVNLLNGLRSNFRDFSECVLTNNANHVDFDSSIPRFESWHASQVKALKKKRNLAALPGSFCRVCFLYDRCSRRAPCGLAGHTPAARCASSDIYRQGGLVALGSSPPGHQLKVQRIYQIRRARTSTQEGTDCRVPLWYRLLRGRGLRHVPSDRSQTSWPSLSAPTELRR